ncbi:MAG: protein-export rane protein SecD [Verrucomicrobiales bacterium]|nr:protein-export rane protein SecD [Verrucomicrobiales bacterium]
MNRNYYLKLALVLFLVAWSVYSIYPPTNRDLIQTFREKAEKPDAAFNAIVKHAEELRDQDRKDKKADHPYANLKEAIGTTNDVTKYFPLVDAKSETDPTRAVLNYVQKEAAGKIHLGLDLRGGSSFLLAMDASSLTNSVNDKKSALDQAVEVLRKRVDRLGVAEPLIQPEGEDRILVQVPGASESEREEIRTTLQKAAFLEFRMVHPDSYEMIKQGSVEPGWVILKEPARHKAGANNEPNAYVVSKKAEKGLTGKYVTHAGVSRDPTTGHPYIDFELNAEGAQKFEQITTEYAPREGKRHQLAIVLDGELYSAPTINGAISGGRAQITGDFTLQEAFSLANTLENPLQAPVKILSENSVDPSLGADTISSGIKSAIYGIIFVAAFMAIYYLFAGVVANVALITNIIILFGVMCSVGTTLTLPGIAGIVLTAGMAVDANVLIFERIREELAHGKSMRGALNAGYSRAFGTIFDSHVTTLISSIILIFMGTGSIKGFGIALTIGVAASLFTALVVTRLVFDFMLDKGLLKSMKMMHFRFPQNINFMKLAKPAFITSWAIIIVGLGVGFTRGEKLLGIDFVGGDNVTLSYQGPKVAAEELRKALDAAKIPEPLIQYQKNEATGGDLLRVTSKGGSGEVIPGVLVKAFPNAGFKLVGKETVGPTVGVEIQKSALVALILSLFGILIYVALRYEFSFAVGAVIAIMHDLLMTIGIYCMANYFTGGAAQFNATVVAALLTIVGFSINDTIVIFDRIREDLKLGVRGTFPEIINQALNQTLSRTIITSGTVFLATLSLYIFGGGAINDFAFTFLVGIITGTYSSIYIASAFVLWWHKGERPKIASQVTMDSVAAKV